MSSLIAKLSLTCAAATQGRWWQGIFAVAISVCFLIRCLQLSSMDLSKFPTRPLSAYMHFRTCTRPTAAQVLSLSFVCTQAIVCRRIPVWSPARSITCLPTAGVKCPMCKGSLTSRFLSKTMRGVRTRVLRHDAYRAYLIC